MLWVNVYKTSLLPQGGLLTNSYYVDFAPSSYLDWFNFAPKVRDFDRAFSGSQTQILAITAAPSPFSGSPAKGRGFTYTPPPSRAFGMRSVSDPLPWRWCLCVAHRPRRGRAHHHWYHDSLNRSDVMMGDKGHYVLKVPRNFQEVERGYLSELGSDYAAWMHMGVGSAQPGNPLAFGTLRTVRVTGVSQMNKARRRQALILNQGVSFQGRVVGLLAAGGMQVQSLAEIVGGDTGHWITANLREVTTSLISGVVALAQSHKDNNEGEDGQDINKGDGWAVRYGPTGAALAELLLTFQKQQAEDLKYLQKFPAKRDVSGEEYFENSDAHEWMDVAAEWASQYGQFGGFDFYNISQEGLKDMGRVDNYTPLQPDLPFNAGFTP